LLLAPGNPASLDLAAKGGPRHPDPARRGVVPVDDLTHQLESEPGVGLEIHLDRVAAS
jgi:hypothetical protein